MRLLVTYLFIVFITLNCSSQKDSSSNKSLHLKSEIETNEAIGLDVRTKKEVQEHASSRAKNIPIDPLLQKMNELDKNKKILVFLNQAAETQWQKNSLKKMVFKVWSILKTGEHGERSQKIRSENNLF